MTATVSLAPARRPAVCARVDTNWLMDSASLSAMTLTVCHAILHSCANHAKMATTWSMANADLFVMIQTATFATLPILAVPAA